MLVVLTLKLALIVWFAITLLKLYVVKAPTDTPSTRTYATWWPEFGVMVKDLFAPLLTETAPVGEIAPFASADAVMVKVEPEAPAWVTVNTLFAMVELAVLEVAPVLAETEYCTVPFPLPLLPEVMVNQDALLPAVQGHVD